MGAKQYSEEKKWNITLKESIEFNNWCSKICVKKILLLEALASLKSLVNFTESII